MNEVNVEIRTDHSCCQLMDYAFCPTFYIWLNNPNHNFVPAPMYIHCSICMDIVLFGMKRRNGREWRNRIVYHQIIWILSYQSFFCFYFRKWKIFVDRDEWMVTIWEDANNGVKIVCDATGKFCRIQFQMKRENKMSTQKWRSWCIGINSFIESAIIDT